MLQPKAEACHYEVFHMGASALPLPAHEVRRLSWLASVDPRTFSKAISGGKVSPMPFTRIERTLREYGLEHLLPPSKRLRHADRESR
jgi:hypothetical protein